MQALTSTQCKFCSNNAFALQRPRFSVCLRTRGVTVQAAATKASDFRRLSVQEIDQQVQDAKRDLFLNFRVPSRTAGQGNQACIWAPRTVSRCSTGITFVIAAAEKAKCSAQVGSREEGRLVVAWLSASATVTQGFQLGSTCADCTAIDGSTGTRARSEHAKTGIQETTEVSTFFVYCWRTFVLSSVKVTNHLQDEERRCWVQQD